MASATVGRNLSALEQAIKANKDELKATNQELKALDKALKIDPSNVELLKQKFEVFNTQAEIGRERVDLFSRQIAQLDERLASGSITQEYYNQKLAELEQQSKIAEIGVNSLTTAVEKQDQALQKQKWDTQTAAVQKATKSMQTYGLVLGGVSAVQSGLSKLIDNWHDMSWFEKVIQGMTIAVGALATAMAIFKVTLNPFAIGAILAAGTAVAVGIGALIGGSKPPKKQGSSDSSGSGDGNYIDTNTYSSQMDNYTSVGNASRSAQASSSDIKLSINVSGADMYNRQVGKDIGQELIHSKSFMDSLGNALGKRVVG